MNSSFPFVIEAAGQFGSQTFSQGFEFNRDQTHSADSLSEEAWAGLYIRSLERELQGNDVVSEIVDLSVSERVLSLYSAFLCLDPERGGEVCYDCLDESDMPNAVEEDQDTLQADSLIQVYPNPFKPNDGDVNNGIPYDGTANSGIIFSNLPANVRIQVYNLKG